MAGLPYSSMAPVFHPDRHVSATVEFTCEELIVSALKGEKVLRPVFLSSIPEELCTPAVIETAFANKVGTLIEVPVIKRTEDICELAHHYGCGDLCHVPLEARTSRICSMYLRAGRGWLRDVPENVLEFQHLLDAAHSGVCKLDEAPEIFWNEALILLFIKRTQYLTQTFKSIPRQLRTPRIYEAAFNRSGFITKYLEKDEWTVANAIAAIQSPNPQFLFMIPDRVANHLIVAELLKEQ